MKRNEGYAIVMLLVAAAILAVGLLVAVPVWQTQIQRENEDELIFRGNQYVEAIRLYQKKFPNQWPKSMEELYKQRFLRRRYPDPMTRDGRWNIILQDVSSLPRTGGVAKSQAGGQRLLLVPEASLPDIPNPHVLGVASISTKASLRLYNDEDSYDKWLFYYGQDPKVKPEISYYGRTEKQ